MNIATDIDLIDDHDTGPRCVECGSTDAACVTGQRIYPHRPDLYGKQFWLCPCGAYCGSHRATGEPLGYPAGAETRRARSAVHRVLDPLWMNAKKGKKKRRHQVYRFLSRALDLPRAETHTAMFDQAQCRRAIEALRTYNPTRENEITAKEDAA